MALLENNPRIFEVHDIDWVMILGKMLRRAKAKDEEDVTIQLHGDATTYYIRRDLVTAKEIARCIGTTVDKVEGAPRIVLGKFHAEKDWEKATVSYVGEA